MTGLAFTLAARAAGVLLAAAVAARCLRSRPAALRHSVWSLALAGTLALPLLSTALAGHRVELRLPWIGSGIGPGSKSPARPAALEATTGDARGNGMPSSRRRPDPPASPQAAGGILSGIWLCGTSILLARCAWGRAALRGLARTARPAAGNGVEELLAEAAAAVGCRHRPRLLTDPRMATPATFGILRPAIVLPLGWETWPHARMRAVLLHELAHVARRDAVPQLLAELVRAVHWLDPLAWYAVRRLAVERERACDDAVLRAGLGASDYAALLVEVARAALASAQPAGRSRSFRAPSSRPGWWRSSIRRCRGIGPAGRSASAPPSWPRAAPWAWPVWTW